MSVKKVFAWRCMGPGSRTGHVLGQQACNRFARSTHKPGWRTKHAISIDEKEKYLQYNPKATSAPPRAGTTGGITDLILVTVILV